MQAEFLPVGTPVSDMQDRRLAWGLPALPSKMVLRHRLFDELDYAGHRGVTLISGLPGCGKSALVSGWVRYADPGEVLWLSLSPADNESPDLWSRVRMELSQLIGEDATNEHPIILVVDNIDAISRADLAGGLVSMVEDLATRIRVILVGRHSTHLPLHRLRMRMDLSELGTDELAATREEAAEFLQSWRPGPVPEEWVRAVHERSQGWTGGIRLACVTMADFGMASDSTDSFRTDWGLVADYFEKEILEQQPADVRDFLYGTSVLDELEPDVCNAVSGRQDAMHLLEALARQNLFTQRLPGTERFRYHPLFREFLLHRLALSGHDREVGARIAAARYLHARGETRAAMRQLADARAYDELFAVALEGTREAWELRQPAHEDLMLPAGIPDTYFEHSPLRIYALCLSYLARLQLEPAAAWLHRMELAIDDEFEGAAGLRERCELLWAMYDLEFVNSEGVMRHLESGRRWMDPDRSAGFYHALRGEQQWVRALDRVLASLLPVVEAQAEIWGGHPARARQILSDTYGVERAATDPFLAGAFGAALMAEGHLRQAHEVAASAIASVEAAGLSISPVTVGPRLVLAQAMYERDDLHGAEEQLAEAERICRAAGQERWRIAIDCELARLDLARGRAQEALRRLDGLKVTESLSRHIALQQSAYETEVRCRISLGDLLGAEDLLIQSQDSKPTPELLARFHLATGRPDRASAEIGQSGFTARGRPSVERLLLQTRVFLQAGNRRAAEQALQRAVNLARGDGFLRVFLDEPNQITDLLSAVSAGGADRFVQDLLSRANAGRVPTRSAQPFILEPLTERERELLGYLPCHLSQSEIAARMFISANTVKTHMKGLYRKLGASSRSEAVDIARDCGLLTATIGV